MSQIRSVYQIGKFEKGQEQWEDLFLVFLKYIKECKHLPFDLDTVRFTLDDIITSVFEEDGSEEEDEKEDETIWTKKDDNGMEGEQEVD